MTGSAGGERKKQIPGGNDRKKGTSNDNDEKPR